MCFALFCCDRFSVDGLCDCCRLIHSKQHKLSKKDKSSFRKQKIGQPMIPDSVSLFTIFIYMKSCYRLRPRHSPIFVRCTCFCSLRPTNLHCSKAKYRYIWSRIRCEDQCHIHVSVRETHEASASRSVWSDESIATK